MSAEIVKTENNATEIKTEGNTFQKYFDMAKECGSKSVTIDLKSETMTIKDTPWSLRREILNV